MTAPSICCRLTVNFREKTETRQYVIAHNDTIREKQNDRHNQIRILNCSRERQHIFKPHSQKQSARIMRTGKYLYLV